LFVPDGMSMTVVARTGSGAAPTRYQPGIGAVDAVPGEGHIQGVRIAVLGPLEVDEGRILLAPRDQVVLEALAARPGETVRADSLADALWGDHLPPSWPKVVQGCVSRLRKALGTTAIVTSGTGYRLVLHRDDIDHLRFEDLLLRAGQLLKTGEPERARYASGQALGLWRGDPLERLTEWETGRIEAERLGERRRDAEDLYAESTIRAGRHGEVLGELHRMVAQQPTRERRWGLLALAQYQAGRQAEALGTLQRARATLVDEFGLDPGPQLAELEKAILGQDPALVARAAAPVTVAVCPYLGLVAYDVGDATAYFGREADATACLRRLDEVGVLAVVGPSGCGKSSLIRAGVAAALVRDGHPVQVVTPGNHPEEVLAQAPPGAGAVFVVDQCEEALSLPEAAPEREAFFAGLVHFAARGRLVLSLRADRLGELAAHPEFAHLAEKGLYLLGGMGPTELRRAIEGPAAQAGLRLEPGLVDLLVREVEGSPGALPLLSHVLRQTWRRREGDTLTVQGYAATGGVRAAVAQSAERLYRELTATQQGMLRDLMVRLVSSDDAGEPIRTRVSRRTVTPDDEHTAVVEALVGARLLSSDGDTVEIAHESLAVAWPRLRSWLDDDVDGLRIMRHLTIAADSWDELGRPDSELYRGGRQARAVEWRQGHDPELTPPERAFLDASAELAETEQRATEEQVRRERRSNQRLRAGLATVAVLLAVSIIAGALAKSAADKADQQSFKASAAARTADARRLSTEALRSTEIDRSLLLAVASTTFDDSADTRVALAQVLDRAPQLIGTTRNNGGFISLALHPDGRSIAAAEPLGGVAVFDATTLREVARTDEVPTRGVRFSPDGHLLVASANPYTAWGERHVDRLPLRLLDPRTVQLLPTQLGGMPPGRVLHESFAFSANGRWLAAGFIHPREADGKTVFRVWDTGDLTRPVRSFTVPFLASARPVVSSDGRRVFVTSSEGGHAFDTSSGRELSSVTAMEPEGFVSSPDGSRLAIRDGNQIRLLDPARLATVSTLSEDGHVESAIAFDSSGKRVAYVVDGTTVVRSLDKPDLPGVRYPTGDQKGASWLVFGRSGTTLYGGRTDGLLLAWDTAGERRYVPASASVQHDLVGSPYLSAVSPDHQTVAHFVRSDQGPAIQFRDLETGSLGPSVPTGHTEGWFGGLQWRPDGQAVASALDDEWVRVWAHDGGRLLEEHRTPGDGVFCVTFSRDSSRLAIGTRNGWVKTFDGGARSASTSIRISDLPVSSITVSDDGRRAVAVAGQEGILLDLSAGTVVRRADLGFAVTDGLTWAPDGRTVAASGVAPSHALFGATAVLDAKTLATVSMVVGPQAGGGSPTYSPDGKRFMTFGEDRARIFDGQTGRVVGSLRSEGLTAAAFGTDSWTVTLVSLTGGVSHWDSRPEAARRAACRIAGRDLSDEEWRNYLPNRTRARIC
jgi:WD40 repeat protein/DNA-binding SARP family transcriptional activator